MNGNKSQTEIEVLREKVAEGKRLLWDEMKRKAAMQREVLALHEQVSNWKSVAVAAAQLAANGSQEFSAEEKVALTTKVQGMYDRCFTTKKSTKTRLGK